MMQSIGPILAGSQHNRAKGQVDIADPDVLGHNRLSSSSLVAAEWLLRTPITQFSASIPRRFAMVVLGTVLVTAVVTATIGAAEAACTFSNPRGSFGVTEPAPGSTAGSAPGAAPATPPATPLGAPTSPLAGGFAYYAPGDLLAQDKGRGRAGDRKIYLPGIVYPLKLASGMEQTPAGKHGHMNSQIWGFGGGGWNGRGAAGGTECDKRNYNPMLQRDNYCEVRGWDMPMCPAGQGHQGQDIRPPACDDDKWDVVAVVDGVITQVTSNTTVRLKGGDGTEYYYLHMHPDSITVEEGSVVKQGHVLGRISNFMNGGRETTHHLHFQVKQSVSIGGSVQRVYVPVFSSLVAAYRKSKGLDPGIDDKGNLIADPTYEIGAAAVDAPKPPFTLWPIPNVAAIDGRLIEPINLARAFRNIDDQAKVTYAVTGLPASLSVDESTGFISGRLDRSASRGVVGGIYTVSATAIDGKGNKASQSFTIKSTSSLPTVTAPITAKTFREGEPVVIAAGAAFSDPNQDPLRFTIQGLPDGLGYDLGTGRITGMLSAGTAAARPDGVYVVTVTAADNIDGAVTQSFALTVLPQKKPDAPQIAAPQAVSPIPQASAFAGQPLAEIDASKYFKPAVGDTGTLSYSANGLPPGLLIDPASGHITGVLPQSAADGTGQYPITVTATNATGGKASQTFLLSVRTQPPVVATPTVNKTYVEGESVTINAGGAFSTPPGSTLTFTVSGLPAGLSFDPEHGMITGTMPIGASQGGADGVYTVAVAAADQRGNVASQAFTIKVTPPVATAQPPAITQALAPVNAIGGETFAPLDVSKSFKPASTPGSTGPLQFSAIGLPEGLSIDAISGIISGTLAPTAGTATPGGNYLATVFATDTSNGLRTTLGLVISVAVKADPPSPPAPPVPPTTEPATPKPAEPAVPVAQPQGWWDWAKSKASGAWGWATGK